MLFIDIDRDKSTGWNGYDYIINRQSPTSKEVDRGKERRQSMGMGRGETGAIYCCRKPAWRSK